MAAELTFATLAELYSYRVGEVTVGRSAWVEETETWYEAMLTGAGELCWRERVAGAGGGDLEISAFALTLLDDADAEEARDTLEAAPLDSPTFTGTPAAPTATPGTDTTQIATTAFVRAEVAALVDSSPSTLDTLNELAAALGDDENFASTVTTALGAKAPLADPALTGTPTAPTAAPGTDTTQLATTAFVQDALDAKVFALRRTILFSDADVDVAAGSVNLQFPAVPAGSVLIGISTDVTTAFDDGEGAGDPYTMSIDLPDGTTLTRNLTTPTGVVSNAYAFPYSGNIGGGLTEIGIAADSGNVGDATQGAVTLTMYFTLPTVTAVAAGGAP